MSNMPSNLPEKLLKGAVVLLFSIFHATSLHSARSDSGMRGYQTNTQHEECCSWHMPEALEIKQEICFPGVITLQPVTKKNHHERQPHVMEKRPFYVVSGR